MDDMRAMERLIEASGTEWTITRPGGLTGKPKGEYVVEPGNSLRGHGSTPRGDLAEALVLGGHRAALAAAGGGRCGVGGRRFLALNVHPERRSSLRAGTPRSSHSRHAGHCISSSIRPRPRGP